MLYIFETLVSEKKRFDIAFNECFGINFFNSLRLHAKMGFNMNRVFNSVKWEVSTKYLDDRLRSFILFKFRLIISSRLKRLIFLHIKSLKKTSSMRALKHRLFLPVRGQRTRTNAQTRKFQKRNRKRTPISMNKKA